MAAVDVGKGEDMLVLIRLTMAGHGQGLQEYIIQRTRRQIRQSSSGVRHCPLFRPLLLSSTQIAPSTVITWF
jgi:hypothetical protein